MRSMAPKNPKRRPNICIHEGILFSAMAEKMTTRMVCVLTRAEAGPMGAPVVKQLMTNMHPIKLKKEARNPLIHLCMSKEPSSLRNATSPMI